MSIVDEDLPVLVDTLRQEGSDNTEIEPPLLPEVEVIEFEGGHVVVARIPELPPSHRPCRVRATGRAYVRGYDGDHTISEQEEEVFRAPRRHA